MSDITKAWAGIGDVKAAMNGLERKMTTYRNTQQNPPGVSRSLFEGSDNRNITADTVQRTIVESRDTHLNYNQRTSSPMKNARNDLAFSDIDSVSTIPSRPINTSKDSRTIQEGMIKLKQKILRQKQASEIMNRKSSTTYTSQQDQQVRFLDPTEYNANGGHQSRTHIVSKDIRKRKKATAPVLEHYPGCNEAQKPVKKQAPPRQLQNTPEPVRQAVQRKVASAEASKKVIITTSSWRQGTALTRKVLGNKTQDTSTTSSTSVTSDTKSNDTSKNVTPPQNTKKKTPVKRKPQKIQKNPVVEPPKVKARHYNPTDVQKYIETTKKQRKKQQTEDRKKQEEAEKEKEKRLQELYNFQKKALKRSTVTSPTSPAPHRKKISSDSDTKKRQTSSESSDKENTLSNRSSIHSRNVPDIPLIPVQTDSKPEEYSPPTRDRTTRGVFITSRDFKDGEDKDLTLTSEQADPTEPAEQQVEELLETYLHGKQGSTPHNLYSEQRQRMDAIRQTALALRQKIYEETNRLTAEASKANQLTGPALVTYSSLMDRQLPGAGNIRHAWVGGEETPLEKTASEMSDVSQVSKVSSVDYKECQFASPTKREPSPEPYQFPLTADHYSVINVYARKRQLEEKRIEEERLRREQDDEEERRSREEVIVRMQEERKREQEKLRELQQELEEDKAKMDELRKQRSLRSGSELRSKSDRTAELDLSATSSLADTRNTESLLQTTSSETSAGSYHFTPEKTEDISIVSASSAKKTLSFSDHDSPDKQEPLYSPAALHRKLRGELARYDTYSAGLEHVHAIEHTQQHTEAQHDTIAIARAMQRGKFDHATEMTELQHKLQQDMLVFQQKLDQVQAQNKIAQAESANTEAEIKVRAAENALEATTRIAESHEAASKELVNMAQHILKSHAKKTDDSTPDKPATPYTPSYSTPQLSKSYDDTDVTMTESEAVSPTNTTLNYTTPGEASLNYTTPGEATLNYTTDVKTELDARESPTKSDIAEEIEEDSAQQSPITPRTARTEDIETPGTGREADIETEIETEMDTSPDKAHESFRAVLPSESHRRRMSASEDSVASVNVSRKDSFTTFTLDQVNTYMKSEAMRARHQKTLLDLRNTALKEKTDAKLQWLDIKKRRIQRKGADEKMPPLIQREKDILAKLAEEQEEIKKLHAVQKAAQAERKKMLVQQREIKLIQERTAALRRKIRYAEDHALTDAEFVSDTEVPEAYNKPYSGYDTDASSVQYELDDYKIQSLTDFNTKIQEEGREVKRLLDMALSEKRETEKLEQEFGISSSSRLPRGITPLTGGGDTSSTSTLKDTPKYASTFEASTPINAGSVPVSPALSIIDQDQSSLEVREMEARIQNLKEELRSKKDEARMLLKDQRLRKKEALRSQENKLRRQIQTVTDVIEKQKTQISTKLRQHSPSRSDKLRSDSPRRSMIHNSRSDASVSPDSSRIISVTSSISEKHDSISESMEKSTKSIPESIEESTKSIEERARDDTSAAKSSGSVSEDLSKFSERSYHKLPSTPSIIENLKSVDDLELDEDMPQVSFLKEKSCPLEEPPQESPQPSLHLSVNEVLEDLSISSGSSMNDTADISVSSFKNLPPATSLSAPAATKPASVEDHSISENISEEISQVSRSHRDREPSASSSHHASSSHRSGTKTISEKLAELNLEDGMMSPQLNKLTSRASIRNSYTLSFESDGNEDEEIKSLLSNIDESLHKSGEVLSAARQTGAAFHMELDVDMLTPAAPAQVEEGRREDREEQGRKGRREDREEQGRKGRKISGEEEDTSRGTFSNLTDLSTPTPATSESTRSTTKRTGPVQLDPLVHSPPKSQQSPVPADPLVPSPHRSQQSPVQADPLVPSPPKSQQSDINRIIAERSQSLRQTSFKAPLTSEIDEELSVADETDRDLDDISHDHVSGTSSHDHVSGTKEESSSVSSSKTMSELKDLISEVSKKQRVKSDSGSATPVQDELLSPRSDSQGDKTISENSSQTSLISQKCVEEVQLDSVLPREDEVTREQEVPRDAMHELPSDLVQEMLRAALQKMLKVRQNKHQKELNSSPKYMERSPTSPEQLSPTRGEPAVFNDTFRDVDLESALSLARTCTAEERPVMTPDLPPPPKVTVKNTADSTRAISAAATRHLAGCIRKKRPCTLATLTLEQDIPEDFNEEETKQADIYQTLILQTTLECFEDLNAEYRLAEQQCADLPPWKAALKRQPRPHWMRQLPTRVTLDNVDTFLPDAVVRILGLSEICQPRKYHHMEHILAQEVRDEEAEWTDYDSDELVVKFRIADAIFDNMIRETVAVFSAIDSRS